MVSGHTSASNKILTNEFCGLLSLNPNPIGCVQNRIEIGGFGTVRVNNLRLALSV